jgi:rhamnosyltransferase
MRPEFFELSPPGARLFASDRAATKIRDIVLGHDIDIVQLEHTELGQFASAVPERAKVILSEIDIAFLTHERRRELRFSERYEESRAFGSTRTDLHRLLRFEVRCAREMDQVHTMSAVDGEALARFLPGGSQSIRVIPNGVSVDDFRPPSPTPDRQDVLFIGNFGHLPNIDALEYLVTDIWPLLRLDRPNARLSVVGANAGDRVQRFAGFPGVKVVGEVPDTRPSYHSHRVMVAPIRAGSGTRLKILEAFAAGTPVVSTSIGAEGLAAEHGTHILLADSPADFARAIDRLLSDDELHSRMAEAARRFVQEHFDWINVAARSLAAYAELMADSATVERPASNDPPTRIDSASGPAITSDKPDASVVIPTLNGGEDLDRCLEAVRNQNGDLRTEILCVDSGSSEGDLETMRCHGVRVHPINRQDFNHGLTRDLGARLTTGRTIVFLNQDAVPAHENWLEELVSPFDDDHETLAAVQGGIAELPNPDDRFYWDSCGDRFYFTSESDRWIAAHGGIGFSTVNCAISRKVWQRYPFGWAAIMEDKKWQREVTEAGFEIHMQPEALVHHTHNYTTRDLLRRCSSEGYGWRTLGEPYTFGDMAGDMINGATLRDLARGLRQRRVRSASELLFPWFRPMALYWGNHIARDVKL